MMKRKDIVVLLASALAAGCTALSDRPSMIDDGVYVMESDIRKPRVERNYGGSDECRVTTQNGTIRIAPAGVHSNAWYEGSVTDGRVSLSIHFNNPDPMIQAMQLRQSWEGVIQQDGNVVGSMEAYAGTNKYMSGTWTLRKKK